jgi:hypothetical protein
VVGGSGRKESHLTAPKAFVYWSVQIVSNVDSRGKQPAHALYIKSAKVQLVEIKRDK